MKKILKASLSSFALIIILVLPYFVFANTAVEKLESFGKASGFSDDTNKDTALAVAGTVVKALFSILGIIFIILFILSGFNWMTAGGDENKLTKAKDTMRRAIIGLLIIVGSWVAWNFVFQALLD